MQARVLGPLGMRNASFRITPQTQPPMARSHVGGQLEPVWELPNRPTGAGIVPPQWIARMRRPGSILAAQRAGDGPGLLGGYGLGTFGFLVEHQLFLGHWGRIDGFITKFGVVPGSTDLAALGGIHQAFTHDMPLRSSIREMLGLVRIEAGRGGLHTRPFFPVVPAALGGGGWIAAAPG